MCGIAGFIAAEQLLANRSGDDRLAAMLRPLTSRGPDSEGTWTNRTGPWRHALGHRRLAILDLSAAANQPMHRDGLTLVFNGEIYNYVELRHELSAGGQHFTTRGDSEVLLVAYQQWGPQCLERFNGMFAFALWDAARQTLFCARDRAGEKPFYYYHGQGLFVFASEIKSLLEFGPPVPRAPHWPRVAEYFAKSYQPLGEETFFAGIRELLPGRQLTVQAEATALHVESQRYWNFPEHTTSGEPLGADELRDCLDDAVRLRLRSDVPVGTCLSGGLDSPSIAAAVTKLRNTTESANFRYQGVHAFAATPEADERPYVAAVAGQLGLEVSWVEVTGEGCRDELDELVYRQEVPFLSPSVYAQRCVFHRAAELGLKVMLDGQGADELFGGYDWAVPRALVAMGAADRCAAWQQWRQVVGPRFPATRLAAQMLLYGWRRRGGEMPDALLPALRVAFTCASLPALLRYADRNSMSFGVEARLPLLDHRLVEATARLRPQDCLDVGYTKALLRRAVGDRLPPAVVGRKDKTAFAVPEAAWIRGPLAAAVREAAAAPFWREFTAPHRRGVLRTALAETAGKPYNRVSWKVLCVSRWHRQFFGQ
jgi:asparagine synthase (glutamine-hydrolysing)